MNTIRIGIAGLGGICKQRHVPGFQALPGVEIAAVSNRSRTSSEAAAAEYNIPHVADSWEALIARDDLDVIVVGTWPYMHRPISIAALQAGKHVFCQARMAMNAAEALDMRDAARASGKIAGLCPAPFGLSVDKTVARLLGEGALGGVHLVRVQGLSGANADPGAPLHWRKDHRLSGLNMLTLGIFIEVVHRWFGPTRTVLAQTQIFTPYRRDATGEEVAIQIPDQALFTAEMDRGVVAQYVIGGMTPCGTDRIEIHGTRASLDYDAANDLLYWLRPGGQRDLVDIPPEERYDTQHWSVERDFIAAVRGGAPYHPDFDDGLRYMRAIQAVYDSAARFERITLDEV